LTSTHPPSGTYQDNEQHLRTVNERDQRLAIITQRYQQAYVHSVWVGRVCRGSRCCLWWPWWIFTPLASRTCACTTLPIVVNSPDLCPHLCLLVRAMELCLHNNNSVRAVSQLQEAVQRVTAEKKTCETKLLQQASTVAEQKRNLSKSVSNLKQARDANSKQAARIEELKAHIVEMENAIRVRAVCVRLALSSIVWRQVLNSFRAKLCPNLCIALPVGFTQTEKDELDDQIETASVRVG